MEESSRGNDGIKRAYAETFPAEPADEFDLSSWAREELQIFGRLTRDILGWKNLTSISAELILKIASRGLQYWKQDEYHPLLICQCGVSMRCKYLAGPPPKIMFGCSMWSPQASKAHQSNLAMHEKTNAKGPEPKAPYCDGRVFERDAKIVLERIEALLGRPSAMRQFFCPVQVRMAQHVGFSLVNHTPPLADEKRWRLYDKLYSLSDRPKDITLQQVKDWNSVKEDPPNPSAFEGFEASEQEQTCMRIMILHLSTLGYRLIHEHVLSHPTPTSDELEVQQYQRLVGTLEADSLLISSLPFLSRMTHDHDYVLHLGGLRTISVKVLPLWRDGKMVAIPLHGMGKNDLGFLYGSSQIVLFHDGERLIMINTLKLLRAALKLGNSMPLTSFASLAPPPLKKGSMTNQELMALNAKPVYNSDIERHNHTSGELACGPGCMDVDSATALRDDYETPGPLPHLPLVWNGAFKTSLSQGKAKDVHLIFTPKEFVAWCDEHDLHCTIESPSFLL